MSEVVTPPATKNTAPYWMIALGLVLAAIGGIVWHHARVVFTNKHMFDSAFGLAASSPWTGGVVAGIVFLALGALVLLAGLIGLTQRH